MRFLRLIISATLCLLIWMIPPAFADTAPPSTQSSASSRPSRESSDDKLSTTHHSITIDGQKINYEATAGTLLLKTDDGKPKANFFFVAYAREEFADNATRPITFVFNGGPGAAAVWLHLGTAGPRRIILGTEGFPGIPPHGLMENDQSWLDDTDLVFIDPVGTGYSRPAEGQKASDFYGVEPDIDSIGNFIRIYLTRYQRWNSPKFLAGESYGTTRAAGLSQHLLSRYGIDLNGIILISTVLNFETIDPTPGNELPYALYLPSYAAIALYHHKLQVPDTGKFLDEVQQYALHDYADALAQGGAISSQTRATVVEKLAQYTGLSREFIDRANLRIDPTQFRKQLLIDQRLILGRFDARMTGLDRDPANSADEYDPSLSRYLAVYSSTFNDYIRRDLKYESDLNYEVLGDIGPWDFGRGGMGYLNVTNNLRDAMTENPSLKVLVCSGYEDLATPFLGTKFTFDHLDLTDRLRSNITMTYYHSGHMIYHDPSALKALKQNIATFIASAMKR